MMRILYHHRTLGEGAEGIHILSMIDAFRKLGHEVEVNALVAAEGELDNGRRGQAPKGLRMGRLLQKMPRAFYELCEIGYNFKGYFDTLRAIRRFRPDFVYDRYNLYNLSVVAAARHCKVPVFLEVNTPYAYQRRTYESLAFRRLASWLEVKIWGKADHVIVVSTPLKEYVTAEGIPAERVEVMPNGADLDQFDPGIASRPPARPGAETVIGFVGSLRKWHGVDFLIDAAAPLLRTREKLRLVIVGDGPIRPELERKVRELGIGESVKFEGAVSRERIGQVIAGFDIAVSPRAVFYQSPMKILEYMAMAKPVVAPSGRNIQDLIESGSEGLLFTEDDAEELRVALDRLHRDPELRRELGARARRRVEQRHTWIGNARRVLELHDHVRKRSE